MKARKYGRISLSNTELREVLESYLGCTIRDELEIGPNRGVMLTLPVPGTHLTVESEFLPPTDERDHFEAVAPLIPFRLACAILVVTEKTLYARAPHMASSIKIRGRWFFKKRLFYEIDSSEEAELPSRKEILEDRERRRRRGEILKPGRHAAGCLRDHEGACRSRRPALSQAERARNRRRILDDLGK